MSKTDQKTGDALETERGKSLVHSLDITPAMRESALSEGQVLFDEEVSPDAVVDFMIQEIELGVKRFKTIVMRLVDKFGESNVRAFGDDIGEAWDEAGNHFEGLDASGSLEDAIEAAKEPVVDIPPRTGLPETTSGKNIEQAKHESGEETHFMKNFIYRSVNLDIERPYYLVVVAIVLAGIAASVFLPPWVYTEQYPGTSMTTKDAGYHFIFRPPSVSKPPAPPVPRGFSDPESDSHQNTYKRYLIAYEAWNKTMFGVQVNWSRLVLQSLALISIGFIAVLIPTACRKILIPTYRKCRGMCHSVMRYITTVVAALGARCAAITKKGEIRIDEDSGTTPPPKYVKKRMINLAPLEWALLIIALALGLILALSAIKFFGPSSHSNQLATLTGQSDNTPQSMEQATPTVDAESQQQDTPTLPAGLDDRLQASLERRGLAAPPPPQVAASPPDQPVVTDENAILAQRLRASLQRSGIAVPPPPVQTPSPQQAMPFSGTVKTYTSAERVAPFEIKASAGGHYLVKLVESNTKVPIMTIFVRSGTTVEVDVPLGNYEVRYASGSAWYGYNDLFGPETAYSKPDKLFNFQVVDNEVRGFTITLYKVLHGNLHTSTIRPEEF